ncbi:MAG: hypothetical protein U9O94_10650 [Nanoarchaeota archaeon]|nr:hypothetical protein [Nanoarchaeota archaeon]
MTDKVFTAREFIETFKMPRLSIAISSVGIKKIFNERGVDVNKDDEIRLFKHNDLVFAIKYKKKYLDIDMTIHVLYVDDYINHKFLNTMKGFL